MNFSPEFLLRLAQSLGWTLLHSLWQGAVLAVLLGLVLRSLRARSAALRHVVCMITLWVLAVGVAGTASKLRPKAAKFTEPKPMLTASRFEKTRAPDRADLSTAFAAPMTEEIAGDSQAVSATGGHSWRGSWRSLIEPLVAWIAWGWMAGVALLSARHGWSWYRLRGWRGRGAPASAEIEHIFTELLNHLGCGVGARLLVSAEAAVPMLTGILKPVVLLPARVISGLGVEEIEAILAHELAHFARRDAWGNLFLVAVETLFFYHPAVWWIAARAREERENAADDLALQLCGDRRVYAGALAHLAELRFAPDAVLAATGGSLLRRIERIVRPTSSETPVSGWGLSVVFAAALLVVTAFFQARAQEPKVIDVAPGTSIQAAIDSAPEGATLRLAAGDWQERIVVNKPLTIEGAGWEKTSISIEEPSSEELEKAGREVSLRARSASNAEERKAAEVEAIKQLYQPAVWVRDARGIAIRSLRVQGKSTRQGSASTLVYVQGSQGSLSDCAVVGPYGNGVQIGTGSELEVRRTLVAALWGEGIIVHGVTGRAGETAVGSLHLADSEVRSVYHYGVAIGRGCDSTVIENCRISGTAWHGIRYDDASPTITGNVISGNARSGIYASGSTHATIRGNLFWRNEMDGISCWTANTDTIEENTFAGNLREGIAVLGDSKPILRRNIFTRSPIAIVCGKITSRNGAATPMGAPVLEANLFWETEVALKLGADSKEAPEGSLLVDPQFRSAEQNDFTLNPGLARAQGHTGAADPVPICGQVGGAG